MKVLQILPELNSGGVERGTLEVAEHLVVHGHEAVVISNGGRLVPKLEALGARHVTLPVHKKSPFSLLQVAPLRRLLATERPDILHARSRVPAWLSWLALKRMNVATRPRLVTTVHGAYSVSPYSAIMTRGERVIAVSRFIESYIRANYPRTSPASIRVIHRGVRPEEFPRGHRPSDKWWEEWHRNFPQLQGKRVFTLTGRLTRLKGHEIFIRLLARLKDRHPDIAGLIVGGEEERDRYVKEMRRLMLKLGLEDRLIFAGHRSDVRDIYAASTAVLSLSTKPESFGRAVLEPLAMGVPAIGYQRGGVGEILEELFPSGAVAPDDLEALVARLEDLLNLGAPPVKVNDKFLLPKMLEDTLNVYRELLPCGMA